MIYNLTELHTKTQPYKTFATEAENNLCYAIAWDGEGATKRYHSFTNFGDFERVVSRINKCKNTDNNRVFDIKQRIYYEIIGKMCKIFFDLDPEKTIHITKYEFDSFIKTDFIHFFNQFMQTNITYDDILIFSRDNTSDIYISSIHIIVKSLQINKYDIPTFLEYLTYMSDNPIVQYFDKKIYTKNRLFNLPYNTKLTYFLKAPTTPRYFMDFNPQNPTPKEYLVSYRVGLERADTKKSITIFKFVKNITNIAIKSAFEKLKMHNRPIEIIEPKTCIYFNKPNESFEFAILNLPNHFYTHSADWKLITCLFKKYNITESQIDLWNDISSQNSMNTYWTNARNTEYYNNIDILTVKSGIPTFKTLLQKYLPKYEFIFETKNTELIEWLVLNTYLQKTEISQCLMDINITTDIYDLNPEYSYNKSTGFLLKNEKVISNFYHEIEFKRIYESQKIQNVIEYENIQDTYVQVDNFIENDKKFFALKAKWGSGKSHFVIKRMVYAFQELGYRTIFLTENNALNRQIEQSYKTDTFPLLSHIDTDSNTLKNTNHNIVCSLESIQKIRFKDTDILVLDEYESIMNHYESDTFDNKNVDKFKLYKSAILTCKKVVLADADISQQRISLIESITNNIEKITTIQANTNNFHDYKFNVFINKTDLFSQLETDIKNTNLKICVASSVRTTNDALFMDYIRLYPNKTILKVDTNGALFNNSNIKLDKSNVLQNLEEILIQYNVDILLYTPTIKTGVSINSEYFDKCYAYGSHNSLCVREFIQMLFRCRRLKQKEINIGFSCGFKTPQPYISREQIENILLGDPSITLFMLKVLNKEDCDISQITTFRNNFNYDPEYFKLKMINEYENYHSKKLYTQEFMIRMLYNHNLKINYIYELESKTEEDTEETEPTQPEEIQMSRITNAPLLPRKLYIEMLYNDTFKKLPFWERTKAEFFYRNMFINGISNVDHYDTDIYDRINIDTFYKKYNVDLTTAYKSICSIVNEEVENIIVKYNDRQKCEINITHELDFNRTTDSRLVVCKLTLDKLGIDMLKLPCHFTNAEFDNKLYNDTEYRDIFKQFIEHTIVDKKDKVFSGAKKDFIGFIKNNLFGFINLSIKYVDKTNTTAPNNRFVVDYKDFAVKRLRVGRLSNTDIKLQESEIVKFKKGFLYKTDTCKIPAYKQVINRYDNTEIVYFTTYQLKNSKKLTILRNRIASETEESYKNVCVDIRNRKILPYIFKDVEKYNEKIFIEYSNLQNIEEPETYEEITEEQPEE